LLGEVRVDKDDVVGFGAEADTLEMDVVDLVEHTAEKGGFGEVDEAIEGGLDEHHFLH